MAKKLAALFAAFSLCVTVLIGGAGTASAAPVQAEPSVSCAGTIFLNFAFYAPGQTDTCTLSGYVSRGLPLVSATLYPADEGFDAKPAARLSLTPGSAGVRVGTGLFNGRGSGTLRITIPKNTVQGEYYIVFSNLFDRSQYAYEYAFIGNFAP